MRREAAYLRHGPYHKESYKRSRLLEIRGVTSVIASKLEVCSCLVCYMAERARVQEG